MSEFYTPSQFLSQEISWFKVC